MFILIEVMSYL